MTAKTYGTVELKAGFWLIRTEPHVVLKLKRLFGRASKQQSKMVSLQATDEVSRDLQWFIQRYPLTVKQPEELARRADRHRHDEDAWQRLIAGEIKPMDFELAIPARDYQRLAATAWITVKGLLLADDVGVGKTLSAITAITRADLRPCVVVTLTHLPRQWKSEINRFAPDLKVHIIKHGTPYDVREAMAKKRKGQPELFEPAFPDVLVINYHKLSKWALSLRQVARSWVFDEVQELRNDEAEKTKAAALGSSGAPYKIGLSATPIYNYGGEFYNIINVLRPGILGTRDEFFREWCKGVGDKAMIKNPNAFGAYLRDSSIMLRRTRSDVKRELPPVTRTLHHCDADADVITKAEDKASELARIILGEDASWQERGMATREIDWRLRQATGTAKAPYVAAFVKMLVESGEKVVLYGWHKAVYDLWAELLKDVEPVFFTGEQSEPQKAKSKDAFVNGTAKVFIISLRAGAGLDGLQFGCRTVVFGELDWSPGVHVQAEGRVARDGQKDPVSVYYLLSDGGSDPIVAEVLGAKRGQINPVIDPGSGDSAMKQTDNAANIRKLAERYVAKRSAEPKQAEVANG